LLRIETINIPYRFTQKEKKRKEKSFRNGRCDFMVKGTKSIKKTTENRRRKS